MMFNKCGLDLYAEAEKSQGYYTTMIDIPFALQQRVEIPNASRYLGYALNAMNSLTGLLIG